MRIKVFLTSFRRLDSEIKALFYTDKISQVVIDSLPGIKLKQSKMKKKQKNQLIFLFISMVVYTQSFSQLMLR